MEGMNSSRSSTPTWLEKRPHTNTRPRYTLPPVLPLSSLPISLFARSKLSKSDRKLLYLHLQVGKHSPASPRLLVPKELLGKPRHRQYMFRTLNAYGILDCIKASTRSGVVRFHTL